MSTLELIDDPIFHKPFEILPVSLFEDVFNLILEHPVKAFIFFIVVFIILVICEFADHRPHP